MLETLNTINYIKHYRNAEGLGFTCSSVNFMMDFKSV